MNKNTGRSESLTHSENYKSTNTEAACALKLLISHSMEEWEEHWVRVRRARVKYRLTQYSCGILSKAGGLPCTWHLPHYQNLTHLTSPDWISTTTLSGRYYHSFFRGGKSEIKKQVQDYTVNRGHSCNYDSDLSPKPASRVINNQR